MSKKIEDIAIDHSATFKRKLISSRVRSWFNRIFPCLYKWKLNRDIRNIL